MGLQATPILTKLRRIPPTYLMKPVAFGINLDVTATATQAVWY